MASAFRQEFSSHPKSTSEISRKYLPEKVSLSTSPGLAASITQPAVARWGRAGYQFRWCRRTGEDLHIVGGVNLIKDYQLGFSEDGELTWQLGNGVRIAIRSEDGAMIALAVIFLLLWIGSGLLGLLHWQLGGIEKLPIVSLDISAASLAVLIAILLAIFDQRSMIKNFHESQRIERKGEEESEDANYKYCPNCGECLRGDTVKCFTCGHLFETRA